jgi:hypothetical protein
LAKVKFAGEMVTWVPAGNLPPWRSTSATHLVRHGAAEHARLETGGIDHAGRSGFWDCPRRGIGVAELGTRDIEIQPGVDSQAQAGPSSADAGCHAVHILASAEVAVVSSADATWATVQSG